MLAATMLGAIGTTAPAFAAGAPESDQVSQILSEVKTQANQLRDDADKLESYTRAQTNWESHAEAVSRIKDDINGMSGMLAKLEKERGASAAWQQTAIDRIVPVAKELAANTTGAIERLSAHPTRLKTPDYQNYLEAIADSAANLAATVNNFVDYGRTRQRLERLASKLELPAGTL
jgi:signal transduction histidine kinase